MQKDLTSLSIREQAKLTRERKIKASDLLNSYLTKIKVKNTKLNALCYYDEKRAAKLAKKIDSEINLGNLTGRLCGTVFSVRDSINVEGMPRSDGSIISLNNSSKKSACLVSVLEEQGAICIGKGNVAENGRAYHTVNPIYGRTNNPISDRLSPGGSGGGDAAALAAGFTSFAVGADSGGSLRVPANACGLYAILPSFGIISDAGMERMPHSVSRMIRRYGFLGRKLDDIKILLSVLSERIVTDSNHLGNLYFHKENILGKKIGFINSINQIKASKEIIQAQEAVKNKLSSQGFICEDTTLNILGSCLEPFIIFEGQVQLAIFDLLLKSLGISPKSKEEGTVMQNLRKRVALELTPLTTDKILTTWQDVDKLRTQSEEIFKDYDFYIMPVSASLPLKQEEEDVVIEGNKYTLEENFLFSSALNILGLPSIAFPCSRTEDGTPVGLQILGRRFSELQMLKILDHF